MSISQLASEDALRLAVLLAGEVHAVRIDEGALTLHALTPRGEAHVALHPDTRAERYLMRVRETLAGHATGSPGGYPVHLRRWTRSGHASPKNLELLLRLGEPEPVDSQADLDPRRYGLIVQSKREPWKRGLLLPDLEGIDTVEKQVYWTRYHKAGISDPDEPV